MALPGTLTKIPSSFWMPCFRILDVEKGNVILSHHVKFDDDVFPYKDLKFLKQEPLDLFFHDSPFLPSDSASLPPLKPPVVNKEHLLTPSPIEPEVIPIDTSANPITNLPKHKGYTWVPDTPDPNQNIIIGDIDPRNILNKSRRKIHSINSVSTLTPDPKTYMQALRSPEKDFWIDAIKTELDNMMKHQVWTPSNHPPNLKPLSTTWVFKKKTDENGNLTKFKAQLCVRGFSQMEGIDYNEVFAPTGRIASLRLLLTLCSLNNTFKTLRLNKSLYGLKQSPRCWHSELRTTLIKLNLHPSEIDPCLFFRKEKLKPFYLYVHIDDLLFGGSWVSDFKIKIQEHFNIEDLSIIEYSLGIRINQKGEYTGLIQDKMISKILTEFQIENCRGNSSPLPSNYQELKNPDLDETPNIPFNYRRVIGLLQYLVQCTQPDLAFSISFLSQFLEHPKDRHYQAVLHVLKYLSYTKTLELKLGIQSLTHSPEEILCFTDSDWGGANEKRSFSGSLIYFFGTIGWKSQKQRVVALSSAEAEYNAMSSCCQDSEWLCQLISEITFKKISSTIYSDNQSSMALASNRIYHHGTRHIDFRLHFIRSLLEDEKITLKYIPTQRMVADLLTKNLPYSKSKGHIEIIFGLECRHKLQGTEE
ncbi:hypothetical protein O181_023328 [Austropuccinia psidii MF-1]|uniref:Reverse transcriptase Ty1/copia-type domain-containing protein n=1 Tax=Austropuccinia psidii MF-1 TaxID=1389203 RepID=A0A9Q3CIK5_9BASI|nr:hypothetical protein [Austropuccinia psidii MF-1]